MLKTAALVTTICLAVATTRADATVLINNATQGFYNSGIGDLAADLFMNDAINNGNGGSARMFPGAGVSQGDPTASFATAPNFSGAGIGITTRWAIG